MVIVTGPEVRMTLDPGGPLGCGFATARVRPSAKTALDMNTSTDNLASFANN